MYGTNQKGENLLFLMSFKRFHETLSDLKSTKQVVIADDDSDLL